MTSVLPHSREANRARQCIGNRPELSKLLLKVYLRQQNDSVMCRCAGLPGNWCAPHPVLMRFEQ
jgi:hypothetical protein